MNRGSESSAGENCLTAEMADTLNIVVPGLLAPASQVELDNRLPSLCKLLSRATRRSGQDVALENLLCVWFSPLSPIGATAAASVGYAREIASVAEPVLRVDPVYQQIDINHAVLGDPGLLQLNTSEAESLAATLNQHLAADDIRLLVASPSRWYMLPGVAWDILSTPLSVAIGRDVARYKLRGREAHRWQALLAELEMLLFDHPVNRARVDAGQLPVNSLWLWGEGQLAVPSQLLVADVYTDDFYTASLAGHYQAQHHPLGAPQARRGRAALVVDTSLQLARSSADANLRAERLAWLEQQVFASAWKQLSRKAWKRITLYDGSQYWSVDAGAKHQFWRRSQPFETFLQPLDSVT